MLEEIREALNSPHQVVVLVSGPPALENLTQNGIFGLVVLPCLSFPHDYIDVFSAIKKIAVLWSWVGWYQKSLPWKLLPYSEWEYGMPQLG